MQRISQGEIIVDNTRKNLVQVKSVNGGLVYTREDYETFIQHFVTLIKELDYSEIYNISSFGALIEGVKNITFADLNLETARNLSSLAFVEPFDFDIQEFMQEEFKSINAIIETLSQGVFSPALVASIIKSVFVYQYMQAEILNVLQRNFDPELAQKFIDNTKLAIKIVVEELQKNKLI